MTSLEQKETDSIQKEINGIRKGAVLVGFIHFLGCCVLFFVPGASGTRYGHCFFCTR